MTESRGLQALEERVIRKDLCTMCGACASLCPYLKSWQGRWVKLNDCDLEDGRCFAYCPRTKTDLDGVHRGVFGEAYQEMDLGRARRVSMARAADTSLREKAQTGGVVSTLMDFALKEGIIDAAVLTHRDEMHLPEGEVARGRDEILACAGSSYVAGPTLEALNRGPWEDAECVGVVGIPCQVMALGKMRVCPPEKRIPPERIALVVGLFCTWALTYRPFMEFLHERLNGAQIRKLDITAPPERLLKATTDDKTWDIPLDEIRSFIRPTCALCTDMTSEFSDVSVGTVEGIQGWNTVIVRTDRGEDLLRRAEAAGIIEVKPLPEAHLEHLKEASLLKKRRALEALKQRNELDNGYLILPPQWAQRILSGPTEVAS